jgi:hypothetical protein
MSAIRQPAFGAGEDDFGFGIDQLGGLGHEPDPAEDDQPGAHRTGLAGELQRVADEVGDVVDVRNLVVVGEDDRANRGLQVADCRFQIGGVG